MGIVFSVVYHKNVVKEDIPKLPTLWNKRIKLSIENKLATSPETFGKPLRKSLKGYRVLRVGNYRVIFWIDQRKVKILAIQHRSVVYKMVEKRI